MEHTGYDHELDRLVVNVGDIAVSPEWVYLPGGQGINRVHHRVDYIRELAAAA